MTREHNFVVDLAKASKPTKMIREIADVAHKNKVLSLRSIQHIMAKVKAGEDPKDKWHLNPKCMMRTMDLVEKVRDFLTQDHCVSLKEIVNEFEIA
jgi:hypothetical protein